MTVDFNNKKVILVVHGVELKGADVASNTKEIDRLVRNRLSGAHLDYAVDIYDYVNLNKDAEDKYKKIASYLIRRPLGSIVSDAIIDLVGDVVISLQNGSVAAEIRTGLVAKINQYYQAGNPLYLAAHSLGSIYSLDIVNEFIGGPGFKRDDRSTWPVQGLVTFGSPIGLALFNKNRPSVGDLGAGNKYFRWFNYYDINDPIVSGNIFGKSITGFDIARDYMSGDPNHGWFIRDTRVDTGKLWIPAHTAYWDNPALGDGLINLMT